MPRLLGEPEGVNPLQDVRGYRRHARRAYGPQPTEHGEVDV